MNELALAVTQVCALIARSKFISYEAEVS